jgi:hypothetical protein
MEWTGTEWRQKFTTKTDMMVAVFDEALVYKYNGSSWVSLENEANGLDCFHPMDGGTTTQLSGSVFDQNDGLGTV